MSDVLKEHELEYGALLFFFGALSVRSSHRCLRQAIRGRVGARFVVISPRWRLVFFGLLPECAYPLAAEGVRSTEVFSSLSPEHIQKLTGKIGDQIRFARAVASVSEDSEFAIPSAIAKKRDRHADATSPAITRTPLKRPRESSSDIYMPDTDPRSTSLYQAIASYVSTRRQEGPKRKSGEKAINAQIMKSGGEPNFVNKVMKLFPQIRDSPLGGNLHGLPLDELCQIVVNTYPQPWMAQISVSKSRESTPSPSPRKEVPQMKK